MQHLDEQALPGRQGLAVDMPGEGQPVTDGGFLGRQEARGPGCDVPAHGVYEFPPQKLKFLTLGQERARVIQMSKNRGSRIDPA